MKNILKSLLCMVFISSFFNSIFISAKGYPLHPGELKRELFEYMSLFWQAGNAFQFEDMTDEKITEKEDNLLKFVKGIKDHRGIKQIKAETGIKKDLSLNNLIHYAVYASGPDSVEENSSALKRKVKVLRTMVDIFEEAGISHRTAKIVIIEKYLLKQISISEYQDMIKSENIKKYIKDRYGHRSHKKRLLLSLISSIKK